MANTVNRLSYANTFGEWVLATDSLVKENNALGKSDYYKDTGTLYLSESTVSLQTSGNIVAQKQLLVQGVGSSATIQNNLTVGGQVSFTNSTLSLTSTGQANINGLLIAQASGDSLWVANTSQLRGTVNVGGLTTISNNLVVTSNTYTGNLFSNTAITTTKLKASTLIDANGAALFVDNIVANQQITTLGNFVIAGATSYNPQSFTINAGSATAANSSFNVNRGSSGANASIFWNETNKVFQSKNVDTGLYYRILTDEYLNDTVTSTSTTSVATANVANSLNSRITSVQLALANTALNYQMNTLGVGTAPDTANPGSIRATGEITAYYSDDRLKTKLGNIENALEKVCSLSGFYYEANETAQALGYKTKRQVGVSAQQVESVLPEVVVPAPISEDYLTVQYERIVPLLIEAIKQLKQEIDELKGNTK